MDQRIQFVLERRSGDVNMAALCRAFGISRQTGYKWLRRFAEVGQLAALAEHSRRPHSHPRTTPMKLQRIVVQARRQHPHWGPRKLRAWLSGRGVDPPAASTIGEILKRAGLVAARRRRRRATPSALPFSTCTAPNQVWCIDFKGEFRTGDGQWCIPLTITDAFSRFIVCCVAGAATDGATVRRILSRIFRDLGLPSAFPQRQRPTVRHHRPGWFVEPVRLVAQARHQSRAHRAWQAAAERSPRAHAPDAEVRDREPAGANAPRTTAARFDRFLCRFNNERPHEALGNATPASLYTPSSRRLPMLIPSFQYPFCETRLVDESGAIRWGRRRLFIGGALANEVVGVQRVGEHYLEILFGPITLGILDEQQLHRGLLRYRVDHRKVSARYPV